MTVLLRVLSFSCKLCILDVYVRKPATQKLDQKLKTLYEVFQKGLSISPNGPYLGGRNIDNIDDTNYYWLTYAQVDNSRKLAGSSILKILNDQKIEYSQDLFSPERPKIGLYSINRPEWVIVEQACNAYSLIVVALYDTLGLDALRYIIKHSEMSICVCSPDKVANLLEISSDCPQLKTIVWMEGRVEGLEIIRKWAATKEMALFSWDEFLKNSADDVKSFVCPHPDTVSTLCYTSGTTGEPKGAILTHRGLASATNSLRQSGIVTYSWDLHLSYLPLAHVFERTVLCVIASTGSAVGFYGGNVLKLLEDLQLLKPTIFVSVPRVFTKIYNKIVANTVASPGFKGYISRKCFQTKMNNWKSGGKLSHAFWDRVICNKIKKVLGGRVRKMITGSAPIDAEVMDFLRVAFGCYIFEGYGSTETCCFGGLTFDNDPSSDNIGAPPFGCELKLVDVPEMRYFTDEAVPKGEICLRGPFMFLGYYKEPEKTAECLDADGWYHTGDIGVITPQSTCIKIVDRKKNIFKLSQGEYVAPEKLENIYLSNCPFIAQLFIYGDSKTSFLVAIAVADPELDMEARAALNGSLLLQDFDRIARKHRLQGFEKIKNVHIEDALFTVESGLVTPTFKLKRHEILQRYKTTIDRLYRDALTQTMEGGVLPRARL